MFQALVVFITDQCITFSSNGDTNALVCSIVSVKTAVWCNFIIIYLHSMQK